MSLFNSTKEVLVIHSGHLSFKKFAVIFGRIYFPRIIIPSAKVISGLLKFCMQFILFLGFYFYYISIGNQQINTSFHTLLLFPIMIIQIALLGQGLGLILSSLTTKYRDLEQKLAENQAAIDNLFIPYKQNIRR